MGETISEKDKKCKVMLCEAFGLDDYTYDNFEQYYSISRFELLEYYRKGYRSASSIEKFRNEKLFESEKQALKDKYIEKINSTEGAKFSQTKNLFNTLSLDIEYGLMDLEYLDNKIYKHQSSYTKCQKALKRCALAAILSATAVVLYSGITQNQSPILNYLSIGLVSSLIPETAIRSYQNHKLNQYNAERAKRVHKISELRYAKEILSNLQNKIEDTNSEIQENQQ